MWQQRLVQVPYISWQQYPGISYAKFHSSVSFQSLPIAHDLIDHNHLYFILPSTELPENHGFRLEGSDSHPRCCNHDIERRHVIISLFVFLGLWELSVCHLHQALSHGNSECVERKGCGKTRQHTNTFCLYACMNCSIDRWSSSIFHKKMFPLFPSSFHDALFYFSPVSVDSPLLPPLFYCTVPSLLSASSDVTLLQCQSLSQMLVYCSSCW